MKVGIGQPEVLGLLLRQRYAVQIQSPALLSTLPNACLQIAKWTAQTKIKKTLDMWHRLSHLTSNFLTKVAKIFGKLLGYFEKVTCLVKTVMATFGQSLENFGLHFIQIATQMAFTVVIIAHWTLTPANTNWALFYSNILSHWLAC